MKVLIIGGVAGGASAAARLRRLDENAEIVIFEKGPYISFANCGMPYYLSREIPEVKNLLLQTPESFYGRFCVDVRVNSEVTKICRKSKKLCIRKTDTDEEYEENYDKLIIATGAEAVCPASITGTDLENVFVLRNIEDMLLFDKYLVGHDVKKVLVGGAGAIGIECAENLEMKGLDVTIASRPAHIIPHVDAEMAIIAERELKKHGIDVRTGCEIQSINKTDNGLIIATNQGNFEADAVLLGLGVLPSSKLAEDAGLELGVKKSIAVNANMQTSDPDIYAVGDVVEVDHFVSQRKQNIALAGPANRQGRIAADNIAGIPSEYKGTQGSVIVNVYDLAVAGTGLTETAARQAGIDYDKLYTHSAAHASYYPNAGMLTTKIIFEKTTGRLLGGQFVGIEGADKRCDVFATALRAGLKATDLIDLELSYSPPYSSAKDPINMAGFAIENILTGKVKNYHWDRLEELYGRDVTLLDVRTVKEYENGSVEGFVNIPLHELRFRLDEIPKDKPVYIHCFSGMRSYVACMLLQGHGYDCYNISGGYFMYGNFYEKK